MLPYIPDRLEEGYGLNREAVELLADRETLAAMSRNLEALARPDAAEDIVNEIVKVMK